MKKLVALILIVLPVLIFTSCEKGKMCEREKHLVLNLKPDEETGKDALIWSVKPDHNSGNNVDFQVMAWSWIAFDLPEGSRRSLIEFDLSTIPQDATIDSARLSLFHNGETYEPIGGHSTLDGSNRCFLIRITEPWEESTVTWNNQPSTTYENNVILEESSSINQDYLAINITAMIQDMISNANYGFMMELLTEEPYRAMIFASSDHPNVNSRPKLDVYYTIHE